MSYRVCVVSGFSYYPRHIHKQRQGSPELHAVAYVYTFGGQVVTSFHRTARCRVREDGATADELRWQVENEAKAWIADNAER